MESQPLLRSSSRSQHDSGSRHPPSYTDHYSRSAEDRQGNAQKAIPGSVNAAAATPPTYGTLKQNVPSPTAASSSSVVSSSRLSQGPEKGNDARQSHHASAGNHGEGFSNGGSSPGEDGEDAGACDRKEPVVVGVMGVKEQRKRMVLLTLLAFLVTCASMIHDPVLDQYVYQVYARQVFGNVSGGIHVNKQPCVNSTNSSGDDAKTKQVQDESGEFQGRLTLTNGGIAVAVNLFLGSFSDVLGRKLLLFLPMIGHFLRNGLTAVIIFFDFSLLGMYPGYVLDGLCGGYCGILVGFYTYSADITENGVERTISVTGVAVSIGLGQCMLGVLDGLFIQEAGFFFPALTSALLLLVCIFVICLLPETVPRDRKARMSPLKALRRMLGTFFPRDERLRRVMLVVGLLGFFLTNVPDMAGDSLDALYLMKEPFCWGSLRQGILTTAKDASSYLATFTIIRLLAKVVCNPLLAVTGLLSEMARCIVMALAKDDLTIYMVVAAGLLRRAVYPPMRAFLSNLVPQDRQGSLFAGIGVVESLSQFISKASIMGVYAATESFMSGFVYLVVAACSLCSAFLFLINWRLLRKLKASKPTILNVQLDKERRRSSQQQPGAETPVT